MTAWASTFSVDTVGNNFIITRNGSGNETVYYRTVSLSAFAGVNYTERTGELIFTGDEAQKTIPVSETPCTVNSYNDWSMMYFIQTGLARTYRFELLDGNGSLLAYKNRDMPFPSSHQFIDTYLNKSVTDLVYFNDDGDIKSGEGNKYIDEAPFYRDPGEGWVKVTDAGYGQGLYGFKAGIASSVSYIPNYFAEKVLGMKVYATVYFTQKEENDGYQYIQIIETDYNHYDDIDPDGAVNDPDISTYKACFELSKNGVTTSEHYQFFPHRYDYENKEAEVDANLSHYEFDYDNSYLWQQKFNSNAERPSTTGSLVFKPYNNHFYVRFDAAGNYDDNWYFKNIRARMALVDQNAPYRIDNCKVSGGKHCKGNTIYVSVPFNEMVKASSSTTLNTTWGTLTYVAGNGSNVLTFCGTISTSASGKFTVNSYGGGTITDLAGNLLTDEISHAFGINLDINTYSISYDLAGGHMQSGQSNPTSYTDASAAITLNQPVRDGYSFKGWTGSNGNTPQPNVTIPAGTVGNLNYTANWELVTYNITYNLNGGSLPAGQSNPNTYTIETPTFTLNNPTKPGFDFEGWTGSNGSTPQTTVSVSQGRWGDISYTANWRVSRYTFNSSTGALSLNWGEFNKDNKWGDDVPASAVTSVTATSQVSFTDDCTGLFLGFINCTSFDLNNVNTSAVTNMKYLFASCKKLTTLDLSGWDTGNVTNMEGMFIYCNSLDSLNVSGLNTQNVENMYEMFYLCKNLKNLDLSGWDTGNVTDMGYLFCSCSSLSSIDVSGFNTENVISMLGMFANCTGLSSIDVSGLNTKNVKKMNGMFSGCSGLTSLDLSGFNTEKVEDINEMFANCTGLTSIDFTGWNTANLTDMGYLFQHCTSMTSFDLSVFNTQNVEIMSGMFCGCTGLDSIDVTVLNTENVIYMGAMLSGCTGLTTINFSGLNTKNVIDLSDMFHNCTGLTSLDLSGFNTQNVEYVDFMFSGCTNLTSVNFSGWNTAKVINMSDMFQNCGSLTSVDVSGFNTENVEEMTGMFSYCTGLTTLDLSGFNTEKVEYIYNMFRDCSSLTTIYGGTGWNTGSIPYSESMFKGCTSLVGGMGTTYNPGHIDKEYARIDGGPDCPGYFTEKPAGKPGDVNGDGEVDVRDITALIDVIMNAISDNPRADVNGDGDIDVRDITALIDIIMNS